MITLTPEEERQKKAIYDKISPRRKKFIDRMGYDNWNPFDKPNDPIDIRTDATKRTTQQLIREFLQSREFDGKYDTAYASGALECALGIINKQDRVLGMYDFSVWYYELLKKEGKLNDAGSES